MRDLLAPLREKEMKFIRPPFFITLDLFANNFNDVIYCLVWFLGAVSTRMVALKTNIWPVWSPIQGKSSKNEFLIEGILTYFNYDVLSHCDSPPAIQKKSKKKEKNKDNEQNMPEEPLENRHELESGVENEKEISKKKTKPRKQNTKPNYIDQDEDLSKEVPRATKKKRREAELSDFEKNVIMKNIEERKKMERELGLYNLSEDIRNIDKPTSTFQERLDDIMGDDV